MSKKTNISTLAICLILQVGYCQSEDWYNEDLGISGTLGVSVDRSYDNFKGQQSEVIVAIIDSGVDVLHEDLKDNIWINKGEIPNNGKDDDNNGYIDDLHGWNFLGGADGQNIITETYGEVRHYRALREKFEGKDTMQLAGKDLEDYSKMLKMKLDIEKKAAASEKELTSIAQFDETLGQVQFLLRPYLDGQNPTEEILNDITAPNDGVQAAKEIMLQLISNGFNERDYLEYKEYHRVRRDFHYNLDYDPRGIVGDNPKDPYERYYGNNDVFGGHADHGTHVAGIIGAVRGNGIGIDGVANNVRLMILRAVPDGDERDKDIANAILYAVENGAKVINMSFGKGHSPHKEAVDKAVQFAAEHNVLIVHAAGNAAVNIDEATHFPVRTFENGLVAENWIEVGASDKVPNAYLPANFSNYGRKEVEVFAPGVDIYSTLPDNQYGENSGTSMAAPVVSGMAAVLLSYYPELKPLEVKRLLVGTVEPFKNLKVYYPDTSGERNRKTKFKKISATGGIVNLYRALSEASNVN